MDKPAIRVSVSTFLTSDSTGIDAQPSVQATFVDVDAALSFAASLINAFQECRNANELLYRLCDGGLPPGLEDMRPMTPEEIAEYLKREGRENDD